MTKLWNPLSPRVGGDGPWWNAPPERAFQAYYMTMRVHYEMTAADALATARRAAPGLGLGTPSGFLGLLHDAINRAKEI